MTTPTAEVLNDIPFFRDLPEALKEKVTQLATCKTLWRGEAAWHETQTSESFVFVAQGRMKLTRQQPSGRLTILEMCEQGELICSNAAFCSAPYCCSALSMQDDTVVVQIPRSPLLDLLKQHGEAATLFMESVNARVIGLCRRVEELASGTVETRIAMLLSKLANASVPENEIDWQSSIPVVVKVPVSRAELAAMCGTTIETAIRTMSSFRKAGIVESDNEGFTLKRPDLLKEIAGDRI